MAGVPLTADQEWIERAEHELGIAGHEDDCRICQGIVYGLQPQRDNRGRMLTWLGPDGRKFLTERDAIDWYRRAQQ